jgi:hypothetical protein
LDEDEVPHQTPPSAQILFALLVVVVPLGFELDAHHGERPRVLEPQARGQEIDRAAAFEDPPEQVTAQATFEVLRRLEPQEVQRGDARRLEQGLPGAVAERCPAFGHEDVTEELLAGPDGDADPGAGARPGRYGDRLLRVEQLPEDALVAEAADHLVRGPAAEDRHPPGLVDRVVEAGVGQHLQLRVVDDDRPADHGGDGVGQGEDVTHRRGVVAGGKLGHGGHDAPNQSVELVPGRLRPQSQEGHPGVGGSRQQRLGKAVRLDLERRGAD